MDRFSGRPWWAAAALLAASVCAAECGSSSPVSPGPLVSPTTSFQFTNAPISLTSQARVNSQRGYNTVGDMSLELFFWAGGPTVQSTDVFAPADGVVMAVTTTSSYYDDLFKRTVNVLRIDFQGSFGYRFYLTGLDSVTVQTGAVVTSGQKVGKVYIEFRQGARSIGLGLIDPVRTVAFARPERYGDDVVRGVFALDAFAEPARSAVLAKVGVVDNGALGQDIVGTLQGLWFLDGSPISNSANRENRGSWLFFIHAMNDPWTSPSPTSMRVIYSHTFPHLSAGGGTLQTDFESDIMSPTDPSPASVTPASGPVRFQVLDGNGSGSYRTVLVQLINNTTLRMQSWDPYTSPGMTAFAFTPAARTYIR